MADNNEKLLELISNAQIAFVNGQYQESMSLAKEAIKLDDQCADAYQCAANVCMSLSRYEDAIAAYRMLAEGSSLSPDQKIEVAFKIGRALEKLRRPREAMDQYYRGVILVYMSGLKDGLLFGAPAQTFFSRAAFAHVDYDLAAGDVKSAVNVLKKVVSAKVPSAVEAKRRIEELQTKGGVE